MLSIAPIPLWRISIWLGFTALLILFPQLAEAQIMNIQINSALGSTCGAGGAGDSMFDGQVGTTQACANNTNLFGRFFCMMETTLGLIMGTVFCSLRDAWLAPFGALMALFLSVVGFGFITGILNFTVKEIALLMFKLALVTFFVLNSGAAMNIAFAFFINISKQTSELMLNSLGVSDPFSNADRNIAKFTDVFSGTNPNGNSIPCALLEYLLGVLIAMPFAALIIMYAAVSYLGIFARAAYGYIYALIIITFLIAAMPIFVSFALFQSTRDLFEHWVTYLVSSSIQIFIVFGLLAFAESVDILAFIGQLAGIITEYDMTITTPVYTVTMSMCTICEPTFSRTAAGILQITNTSCNGAPGIPIMDMVRRPRIIEFLVVNGAALWVLTKVMEQLLAMGPDLGKMLGGTRFIHTYGGSSTLGGNAVLSSMFHGATQKFELGFGKGWKESAKRTSGTFLYRTTVGRFVDAGSRAVDTVVRGDYVMDSDELVAAQEALEKKNARLGEFFNRAQENYTRDKANFADAQEKFAAGKMSSERYDEIFFNFNNSHNQFKYFMNLSEQAKNEDFERGPGVLDEIATYFDVSLGRRVTDPLKEGPRKESLVEEGFDRGATHRLD